MDFIPSVPVLLQYTVACFVLFITPGPDMSLWFARTMSGGRASGMAAMVGTNIGCLIHSVLAALGISVLISASPVAFNAMKVVGALYLLWLAFSAIRHGSVLTVTADGTPAKPNLWGDMATGLVINLSNPKVVLFFVTFLPLFVDAHDPNAPGKLLFLGLYFIVFNIPLSAAAILMADRLVGWLKRQPSVMRAVDYVFAGVFGFFALTILQAQAKHG